MIVLWPPGGQPGLPPFPVWPPPSGGFPQLAPLESGPKKASPSLSQITTSNLS